MRHLPLAMLLGWILIPAATAAECKQGELMFTFSNLRVSQAFALFADFAGLQARIDQTISQSEPMNFGCTNWRVAAENLARKHDLSLKIENGVMHVSKK